MDPNLNPQQLKAEDTVQWKGRNYRVLCYYVGFCDLRAVMGGKIEKKIPVAELTKLYQGTP